MKRWLGWLTVLLVLVPATAWADAAADHYNRGNRLFEQNEFTAALEAYEAAFAAGADDADLFLNLGNAAFRAGQHGEAVWACEMGLRLAPRDEDLRYNLRYAEAFLRDELPEGEHAFLVRLAQRVALTFSAREALGIALFAWLILGVTAMLWLPRRRSWLLALGIAAVFILLIFGPLAGWRIYDQHVISRAVVIAEEAVVRTAPAADAPEAFTIHSGLRFELIDQRADFARIRVASGLQGWIPKESFRRLMP
ncbi:MAG: SH3 domain-containing protein [Candidatus Lernaella stagnicola]|nr:SH3 domain-containing protein [Candidatus Lernaella stagnicola]